MNYLKRYWLLVLGIMALTLVVDGCKPKPKPVTPEPPKPVTATLSANPSSIQRGQSTTLTWSTQNADNASLDGSNVSLTGSTQVSPTDTTTYHLHAKGAGGEQDASATVTVMPPPTPTPTPRPTPPPLTDEQIFTQSVQDIYFDFDKSNLRPDALETLSRNAAAIKAHPNWKVKIEGNCDERGSTEYNLALGERRADAAKQYMLRTGIAADALSTISYGKEKPVCSESNEDCWQKNRHDHFVLLSH